MSLSRDGGALEGLGVSWGKAWIGALEGGAVPDPDGLSAGRTAAQRAKVNSLELAPGIVRAAVGSETAQVGVALLDDAVWNAILDEVMGQAAMIAMFLSGTVPLDLQMALLPGFGEVSPDCSCTAYVAPCKHAAALCHELGSLMDADPFTLLQLRGRSRSELVAEIKNRRAEADGSIVRTETHQPRGADPGMSAAVAWKRPERPLPMPLPMGREPGRLRHLASPPPADSGIPLNELQELVADASQRAFHMLAGDGDSALSLQPGADVARRAATGDIDRISHTTRLDYHELVAAAQAWRHGRAGGLAVSRTQLDPQPELMEPGRLALGEGARVRGNWVSQGSIQLRRDRDGGWWRFAADDVLGWVLVSDVAADPTELLD